MVNIVSKLLENTLVHEIKNISNAVVVKKEKNKEVKYVISTEGVNFKVIANLDFIDINTMDSNDIH